MIRTQIQFTKGQLRQLRDLAHKEGVSVAEVVRRSVDVALCKAGSERALLYEKAWGVVGAFRDKDGARDVARKHDRYLEDAFR